MLYPSESRADRRELADAELRVREAAEALEADAQALAAALGRDSSPAAALRYRLQKDIAECEVAFANAKALAGRTQRAENELSRVVIGAIPAVMFSAVALFVIYVFLWQPLTDSTFGDSRWAAGLFILAPLLVALSAGWAYVAMYEMGDPGKWRAVGRRLAAAICLPIVAVAIWAAFIRPDQEVRSDAAVVWAAYTARFPEGELDKPFIAERRDKYVTICASRRGPDFLCLEIDLNRSAGRQVAGGFDTPIVEDASVDYGDPEPGPRGGGGAGSVPAMSYEPRNCFGNTIACAE